MQLFIQPADLQPEDDVIAFIGPEDSAPITFLVGTRAWLKNFLYEDEWLLVETSD